MIDHEDQRQCDMSVLALPLALACTTKLKGGCADPVTSGEEAHEGVLLGAEKARHHKERFVSSPHDGSLHASIYTWWGILDKLMVRSLKGQPTPPMASLYGYLRSGAQLNRYIEAIRRPGVRRYCEVGTNGGHGTVAMLLANPQLSIVSFDMWAWPYSRAVFDLLSASFPGRLRAYVGSSYGDAAARGARIANLHGYMPPAGACGSAASPTDEFIGRASLREAASRHAKGSGGRGVNGTTAASTVACFAELVRRGVEPPCDVMLVDGDHGMEGSLADLANVAHLAPCGPHTLLADDTSRLDEFAKTGVPPAAELGGDGAAAAVFTANASGLLAIDEAYQYTSSGPDNPCLRSTKGRLSICIAKWGFITAHYQGAPACKVKAS